MNKKKYIRDLAKEYNIEYRYWEKEVFGVLLQYGEPQIRQIFKTVQQKHKIGKIKKSRWTFGKRYGWNLRVSVNWGIISRYVCFGNKTREI